MFTRGRVYDAGSVSMVCQSGSGGLKMTIPLGVVGQRYPWMRHRKQFGFLTRVGENPGRLVALSGVLPVFHGLIHRAWSPGVIPVKFDHL
jgi:hypothetical protein